MKRFLCFVLIALMLCFAMGACANSVNLPDELAELFPADSGYDGYHMLACDTQTGGGTPSDMAAFVMGSQDHNELFVAAPSDGKWKIVCKSTTALYQPGESGAGSCTIEKTAANSFTLSCPGERYTFTLSDDSGWILVDAEFEKEDCIVKIRDDTNYTYIYSQAGETAIWCVDAITVENFNITLMPRTTADVKHLNAVQEMAVHDALGEGLITDDAGPADVSVFAAPSEDAYRAADGKAAVSLLADYWQLGRQGEWCFIRYNISNSAAHYGYIHMPDIAATMSESILTHRMVTLGEAAGITDDPWLSQNPLATLDKGQTVDFLTIYNAYYAYIETEIDGKIARGFIPLRAITTTAERDGTVLPELFGSWRVWSGGTMYAEAITFNEDGTCLGYYLKDDASDDLYFGTHGKWFVEPYDTAYSLFWDNPPHMITFISDNGPVECYGVSFSDDGLSLSTDEGGGGYQKLSDSDVDKLKSLSDNSAGQ